MTTFTTDDRVSAELEVMPAASSIVNSQIPIAFQCFKTPEHYVLEANIPEEIEYIKSLGFQRLVPLYDRPAPQEWIIKSEYKELTELGAEQALQDWIATQCLPVSEIEEHGFINGFRWAQEILRKASA